MFSFVLPRDFVDGYRTREVPWGYKDAGGNSFGELVFLDKYSRLKDDGSKETWVDVCQRVINGMYTVQKDHAKGHRLPWSDRKAQASAQEAFDRMFHFKWTPPGRGLWVMGTELVMLQRNSAPLQNCAFVSTGDMTKIDPTKPFAFLMEASMLGVGVGFDLLGAEKDFTIGDPSETQSTQMDHFIIPDTREGWVESMRTLLECYLKPNHGEVTFDYSLIRAAGEPIKTFGGTAAGPEPLRELHQRIRKQFAGRGGHALTSLDILDLANHIGCCVVAGNVRRSAELALGSPWDKDFVQAKDYEVHAYRAPWGWMSNNSLDVAVGTDYAPFVDNIALNGEPGLIWMDMSRAYGRIIDGPNHKDHRAKGYNPCAEQTLESYECCTLVETFISRHDSLEDFKRTLKFAYLYAKTVTLIPTHWEETNAIMQRNRRIGCSVSGVAEFADRVGMTELRTWFNTGYDTVRAYDKTYSEWLCVRESIKTTSVKPSGTVSQLAGVTPGVHWAPGGEYFMRAMRMGIHSPLVPQLRAAGYRIEADVQQPDTTVVAYFPIHSSSARPAKDVTMWEKANLAVVAQRYWSDNSVSVTVTFDSQREGNDLAALLHMVEGQLKTISFLPAGNKVYPQQPYTTISAPDYDGWVGRLGVVDTSVLYDASNAQEAEGEAYCDADGVCLVPERA